MCSNAAVEKKKENEKEKGKEKATEDKLRDMYLLISSASSCRLTSSADVSVGRRCSYSMTQAEEVAIVGDAVVCVRVGDGGGCAHDGGLSHPLLHVPSARCGSGCTAAK